MNRNFQSLIFFFAFAKNIFQCSRISCRVIFVQCVFLIKKEKSYLLQLHPVQYCHNLNVVFIWDIIYFIILKPNAERNFYHSFMIACWFVGCLVLFMCGTINNTSTAYQTMLCFINEKTHSLCCPLNTWWNERVHQFIIIVFKFKFQRKILYLYSVSTVQQSSSKWNI